MLHVKLFRNEPQLTGLLNFQPVCATFWTRQSTEKDTTKTSPVFYVLGLAHFHIALSIFYLLRLWCSFSEISPILLRLLCFECYCFINAVNVLKHPVTKFLINFNLKLFMVIIRYFYQLFIYI